jgi:hypothetical protein
LIEVDWQLHGGIKAREKQVARCNGDCTSGLFADAILFTLDNFSLSKIICQWLVFLQGTK